VGGTCIPSEETLAGRETIATSKINGHGRGLLWRGLGSSSLGGNCQFLQHSRIAFEGERKVQRGSASKFEVKCSRKWWGEASPKSLLASQARVTMQEDDLRPEARRKETVLAQEEERKDLGAGRG